MKELDIRISYEAIYDIVESEEHIQTKFGSTRALKYRKDIYGEIKCLSTDAEMYSPSGLLYRGYTIYKKPVSPAIIFWILKDDVVHILRITREEYDWQGFFKMHQNYEYSYLDSYNIR